VKYIKELKEASTTNPYLQIKQIEKLFNGNWKKDWNDNNQKKWFPWFRMNTSSGPLGFGGSYYHDGFSDGQVAFYKDEKTSNHIGKYFFNIYQKL